MIARYIRVRADPEIPGKNLAGGSRMLGRGPRGAESHPASPPQGRQPANKPFNGTNPPVLRRGAGSAVRPVLRRRGLDRFVPMLIIAGTRGDDGVRGGSLLASEVR